MQEPVIQIEALSYAFGHTQALRDLNMAVRAGQVVAVLGPNGAGKSTLFKVLMGLLEPCSGGASVFGQPVRAVDAPTRQRLASVIDGHDPPPWATVTMLLGLQQSATPAFDRKAALAMLAEKKIPLSRRYGRLSKGQRRHVLLSLTLTTGAELLLLDEPADGLDTATRRALYDSIRQRANADGTTVLVATHNIQDVERVADEVVILVDGHGCLQESLETLRDEVREIALAKDAPVPFPEDLILAQRAVNGNTHYLLRQSTATIAALADARLSPESLRPVNLENFYLAITENPTPTSTGATPC